MAQEKITIKFKPAGHKALIKAINELNKATQKLQGNVNKASNAIEGHRQRVKANTKANTAFWFSFARLNSIIAMYRNQMLLAAFAMAVLIRPVKNAIVEFAKFQDLERGFQNLGRGIGATSEALIKLEDATDGTVDSIELMTQANNAMMLGVVKSEDEMAELFDIAQRLGQALGRDTVSSIESLVTGMGRQSRLMLDNLGIIVKSEDAYRQYAIANKMSASALSDSQKKQAFNNETMRQARSIVDDLGIEVLNTNQHVASFQVSGAKLARAFGEVLAPALVVTAKAVKTIAKYVDARAIKSVAAATFVVVGAIVALKYVLIPLIFNLASASFGLMTYSQALGIATLKQRIFNIAVLKNPYVIAAAAIIALAVYLYKYVYAVDEATQAEIDAKEAKKKLDDAIKENVISLTKELALLNARTDAEKRAIEAGRDLHESELELIDAINAKKVALDAEKQALRDKVKLEKEIEDLISSTTQATLEQTREKLDLLETEQAIILKSINQKKNLIANYDQEQAMIRTNIDLYSDEIDQQKENIQTTRDAIRQSNINLAARKTMAAQSDYHLGLYTKEIAKNEELNKTLEDQKKVLTKTTMSADALVEVLNTPLNEEELVRLEERYKALGFAVDDVRTAVIDMYAEMNKVDVLGENLTMAMETVAGFLDKEVELTQAAAQAKIKVYDDEAKGKIDSLKKSRKFQKKSDALQQKEIDKINKDAEKKKDAVKKKANKQLGIQFRLNQALAINESIMNTSIAYTKALAQGGFVIGIPMATAVAILGAVQVATIAAQKPPKMARGGLVGGRSHSQGGTLVEAEEGEFVISRNAVEAIGVENLNKMNRGAGAPTSVSFQGNVLSDDFIETEAIPKIREAIRRGADIGKS